MRNHRVFPGVGLFLAALLAGSNLRAGEAAPPASGPPAPPSASTVPAAPAATPGEVENLRRRVEALEARSPAPPAPAAPTAPARGTAASGSSQRGFNPDISVLGDFVGQYSSREGIQPDDGFFLREVELGLGAAVDPYCRMDAFLGIEEEDGEFHVDIEEAYATFPALPGGVSLKVGKFKAAFGKVNPLHPHAWPWTFAPAVYTSFLGDEGLSGTGVSASWLVPNPWDRYLQLTGEVFMNDNEALFAGDEADDVVLLLHAKSFWEIGTDSTIEAGASFATGPNDAEHGARRTWAEGADLTWKWAPTGRRHYRGLSWQTEAILSQKDREDGTAAGAWGMYTSLETRLARRWWLGGRYDFSQAPDDAGVRVHSGTASVTFAQSEFAFWRLGVEHTDRGGSAADLGDETRVFLQFNFGVGPHRAHAY